jgi:hypothetical protein
MHENAPVWLTRLEFAQRERVPVKTVAEWAYKRTGPPFAKIGRHARYLLTDIELWEAEQFKDDPSGTAEPDNDPSGPAEPDNESDGHAA